MNFSFLNKQPTLIETSTIGLPHYFKSYKLSDGSLVNVKLFDTVGQEKYKSIGNKYYNDADCCLLVYSIDDKKSFEEIKSYYLKKIRDKCKKHIKVILLGNKTDLDKKREISTKEGNDLALKNGFIFMETSCLLNLNVAGAFETLIENTNIEIQKLREEKDTLELKNTKTPKVGGKCICEK